LRQGDTVLDFGCGTGLNFPYLEESVGDKGQIIGVHLTDAMIDQAWKRIKTAAWSNVELLRTDLARFLFSSGIAGKRSTLAIAVVPEYDDVIRRGAMALRPHERLAVFDLKKPDHRPLWLIRLGSICRLSAARAGTTRLPGPR
jgi:ubiquinone/menaquinone biosynthesis C-methylase UbiE